MEDKVKKMILHPVLVEVISEKQKSYISEIFEVTGDDLSQLLNEKISIEEIKLITKDLNKEKRLECFQLSKKILELEKISMSQLIALSELGKILEIDEKDTGFDFNIYNQEEIINYEFNKTLINFSMISGVIGFIPFIPFSDYLILTPLQIAMITKIFNLYKFEMEPKEFLKVIGATLGAGLLFKGISKIVTNFIPFLGWFVNASIAFSGTYAIGIVARRYALAKGEINEESLKNIWEKSFEDGKKEFEKLKKFIFEQKDNLFKEFQKYNEEKSEEEKDLPKNTKNRRGKKTRTTEEDEDSMFQ